MPLPEHPPWNVGRKLAKLSRMNFLLLDRAIISSMPVLTTTIPNLFPLGARGTSLINLVMNSSTNGFHVTLPLASVWPNSAEASMTIMMSDINGLMSAVMR